MDALTLIIVILLVMWIAGMGVGYSLGGLIHLLLVIALIVIIVRVAQCRKVL